MEMAERKYLKVTARGWSERRAASEEDNQHSPGGENKCSCWLRSGRLGLESHVQVLAASKSLRIWARAVPALHYFALTVSLGVLCSLFSWKKLQTTDFLDIEGKMSFSALLACTEKPL